MSFSLRIKLALCKNLSIKFVKVNHCRAYHIQFKKHLENYLMAQRSITSFFKYKPPVVESVNDNEVKVLSSENDCGKSNKRNYASGSDDEVEDVIRHKIKAKCIRMLSDSENEEPNSQFKSPNKETKEVTGTFQNNESLKSPNKLIKRVEKLNEDISEELSKEATDDTEQVKSPMESVSKNEKKNIIGKTKMKQKTKKISDHITEESSKEITDDREEVKSPDESVTRNVQENTIGKTKHKQKTKKNILSKDGKSKGKDPKNSTRNNKNKTNSSLINNVKNKVESPLGNSPENQENSVLGNDEDELDAENKSLNESNSIPKSERKTDVTKVMDCKAASEAGSAGSEYNPKKSNYHVINDAIWKHGEKVPYLALARTFREIEDHSARLKIIEILSNYFRSVIILSPDDLLPSVYLCLNKLGPVYEGIELGVAETYLTKAIAQCTGRNMKQIKADAGVSGDLGIIAETSRTHQRMMFQPAPLTIQSVFNKLKEIALLGGNTAMTKKVDKIQALFVACKPCEARYVIRSLAGKLRIGLAEQSVLQALAVAFVTTPPGQNYPPEQLDISKTLPKNEFKQLVEENALILKTAYCECPNYDMIIPAVLKYGISSLPQHCKLTPGIPLKPMLAQPTKCITEVFQQFEGIKFTCEWKYDGERAQIHLCEDGSFKIYSRNLEDNTSKYPDIISGIRSALKPDVKSCVIDTETVAWDRDRKCIRPFQVLSTRKRKDASESEIKVQINVFMFDLLFLNGRSLVQETFAERRRLLKEHFIEVDDKFSYVTFMDTTTMEEVQEFLEESVKGNCEGLMVKSLEKDADYKIAKRARSWLKLKKDYLHGVGDTLDLVVIGGYLGKGKRTGTYGGFLLACYDTESEEYQTICRIGTGFSDENLATHTEFFKEHIIPAPRSYYRYNPSLEPDHWFNTVQVWEVKCADLSLSPVHLAAIGTVSSDKGISLRFPRYLRTRPDKNVEDATSATQVAELYKNQDQIKNQANNSKEISEEDFY